MGATRSFAGYYLVVSLSVAGLGLDKTRLDWWSIPIAVLLLLDLLPSVNMWRQKSFGWRVDWDRVRAQEQAQVPSQPVPAQV
jgi:hypothetical protein